MVRGEPGAWDAQVCLAWGDSVLTWLRTEFSRDSDTNPATVSKDGEESVPCVWRMTFAPGEALRLAKLDQEDVKDVAGHGDEDGFGFLPRWFLENEEAYKAANRETTGAPVGKTAAESSVDGEATNGRVDRERYDAVFNASLPRPTTPGAASSSWKLFLVYAIPRSTAIASSNPTRFCCSDHL
ncbi:hypothetical protein PENSPDRAFT_654147 [Peniophora sp. CONT]|nr:hypothetical protein PENSPDRAFT_654147 [Peniophora sp. CONT]